jgi:hypothetical protein
MRGSMRKTLGAWDKPLPKISQARSFRIGTDAESLRELSTRLTSCIWWALGAVFWAMAGFCILVILLLIIGLIGSLRQ